MRETAWFAGFVDGEECFTLDNKAALVAVRAFEGDPEPLPEPSQLRLVEGSR